MGTTTLLRPDGTSLLVNDEDVPVLTRLGYKPQTIDQEETAHVNQAAQDYYTQPGQRIATGLQGAVSGASFGLSDLFMDDPETQERAKYNPGYRIGGELLGGFLAPVGPIGDAAEALTGGLNLGKTATAVVRGGAEGAAFGAGGAITSAKMNGDPLTAEAIMAGAGWGTVFGGGIGAITSRAGDMLDGAAARAKKTDMAADWEPGTPERLDLERAQADARVNTVVSDGIKDQQTRIDGQGDLHYREFAGEVRDAQEQVSQALKTISDSVEGDSVKPNFDELKKSNDKLYNWLITPEGSDSTALAETAGPVGETQVSQTSSAKPTAEAMEPMAVDSYLKDTPKSAPAPTEPPFIVRLKDGKAELSDGTTVTPAQYRKMQAEYKASKAPAPATEAPATPTPKSGLAAKAKPVDAIPGDAIPAGTQPKPRINAVRSAANKAQKSLDQAIAAGKAKNFRQMADKLENYKAAVEEIGAHFNSSPVSTESVDGLLTFAQDRFARAGKAADTVGQLSALKSALADMPTHTRGFSAMTSAKTERISAALDSFTKYPAAEFQGIKNGLQTSLENYQQRLGITVGGEGATLGSQFRTIQQTLREMTSKKAAEEAIRIQQGRAAWGKVSRAEEDYMKARMAPPPTNPKGGPGLGKTMLATLAGVGGEELAHKAGLHNGFLRYGAYKAVKSSVAAMLGLKGAVMGHIADSVKSWGPRAAKVIRAIPAGRVEPMARRINGAVDQSYKDKTELMTRRAEEIRSAAPTVRDTLYKSLAGLGAEHPELASAMHELAAKQFAFILDKLPQDPGGAYNALQTLWKPDPVDALKFSRYYAVFHDPVGEIHTALKTGKVTPELTEGLREMYPELYMEMKTDLIMRLSDPSVWRSMSYSEQVNIGMLLGFPVHSTMRPQFVAAQSSMFKQRNDPAGIKPQAGAGGGGGRPPGAGGAGRGSSGPGTTQAQRITNH